MDESDPEEKMFPPAEDSGDISSSERQQQKFQLTPEQPAFLEHDRSKMVLPPQGMAPAKLGMMSPRTAAAAAAVSGQPITFFRDTRPQGRWDSIQTRIIVRGGMQILVVEDHQDTREVLTGLLKRWGHDVSPADSLKSGMDRLDNEPPVEVILSDIALPDGTGYALVS